MTADWSRKCFARSTKCFQRSTKCVARSTKCVARSTKCFQRSTKCVERSTKCFQRSTKCVERSTKCFKRSTKCFHNPIFSLPKSEKSRFSEIYAFRPHFRPHFRKKKRRVSPPPFVFIFPPSKTINGVNSDFRFVRIRRVKSADLPLRIFFTDVNVGGEFVFCHFVR